MIYVISHKVPDTDSIIASIIYSNYLNKTGTAATPIKLGNINNETSFILSKAGIAVPETVTSLEAGSLVALVDHNEKTQTIGNIDELVIHSLVDHHKIGNLSTSEPIFIRVEKLCSTNSILAKMFKDSGLVPTKEEAFLMISAIISDNLYFRSPTTTDEDKKIVEELNKIAGIEDLQAYSMEMFNAKSDLGDISAEELIKLDYKEFDLNGTKAGVGTVETTNPAYSLGRKEELLECMNKLRSESDLDMIILSIVDIINEKNITMIPGDFEAKVIKEVFGADTADGLADLGRRLSRKKEIIPQLTEYFKK